MAHSKSADLPKKPRPDFPLYVHRSDRWAKKVRGVLHYFGKATADPNGEAALRLWLDQRDDLLAGRPPRQKVEGLTVADLCHNYLEEKRRLLVNNEITPRTFDDAKSTTDRLVAEFGKNRLVAHLGPPDFSQLRGSLSKTLGAVALGNAVQRVRSVFNYGRGEGQIEHEVVFGTAFKRPSKKTIRLERKEKGPRLFKPAELRKLINAAESQLKAMIYLAVNGGLGNSDIANLKFRDLDLEAGWLDYARPKTGIDRRIPLWPETLKAVQAAIANRPEAKLKDDADLVFITKYGHSWGKLGRYSIEDTAPSGGDGSAETKKTKRISSNNALSKEFRKLTKAAGINRTVYDCRHTFQTIGDGARDQIAVSAIMGHADASMAATYREAMADDERLRAVADHVRAWLLGDQSKDGKDGKSSAAAPDRPTRKISPEAADGPRLRLYAG